LEAVVEKLIRAPRLYEQIVQQIEGSIRKSMLKPGDQLPAERALAERFGVSRTAVREAVKALREKGLVEAYSGRGTFITNGTSQVIRNSFDLMINMDHRDSAARLVEFRELLEPEVAALAATRITDQHLTIMRKAVAAMDETMEDDPEAFVQADLDFHLALAESVANPLVLSLLNPIVGLLRKERLKTFEVQGGPQRGQFHHRRILEAVEARDPKSARDAMKAHLQQVREDSADRNRPAPVVGA
jgi:GntR family transcriptional regulator, transcriptional repressor for pyruvate dehydrogenase complex